MQGERLDEGHKARYDLCPAVLSLASRLNMYLVDEEAIEEFTVFSQGETAMDQGETAMDQGETGFTCTCDGGIACHEGGDPCYKAFLLHGKPVEGSFHDQKLEDATVKIDDILLNVRDDRVPSRDLAIIATPDGLFLVWVSKGDKAKVIRDILRTEPPPP